MVDGKNITLIVSIKIIMIIIFFVRNLNIHFANSKITTVPKVLEMWDIIIS